MAEPRRTSDDNIERRKEDGKKQKEIGKFLHGSSLQGRTSSEYIEG